MVIKKYPNPNINGRPLVDCLGCGERKEHHAKGYCDKCYKKHWMPEIIVCKSCGRKRPHKAYNLCGGCHMRLYHYDKTKAYNAKKYHNISLEQLRKFTDSCICCGFDKLVELHHLDGDTLNNNESNLVGLCPNCHRMIHSYQYYEDIKQKLRNKGYDVEKVHPSNYVKR